MFGRAPFGVDPFSGGSYATSAGCCCGGGLTCCSGITIPVTLTVTITEAGPTCGGGFAGTYTIVRQPDGKWEYIDESFEACRLIAITLECLATGLTDCNNVPRTCSACSDTGASDCIDDLILSLRYWGTSSGVQYSFCLWGTCSCSPFSWSVSYDGGGIWGDGCNGNNCTISVTITA